MLPVHHPRPNSRPDSPQRRDMPSRQPSEMSLRPIVIRLSSNLPLAFQFHLVDELLGQGVLDLPEAIVVQFRRVDVAANQFGGERLAQREAAGDGAIGVV